MADGRRALPSGPVAIGGIGGSGTRLVAAIVRELGFYLGSDLNEPLDNLWFTILLKRPRWYARDVESGARGVHRMLRILEHAMTGNERLGPRDAAAVLHAAVSIGVNGHDHEGRGKGIGWPVGRVRSLLGGSPPALSRGTGWGWKEPNTHIALPELIDHFAELRYIHVIRHGYEVACGENQAQLYNWGPMFGVDPPRPGEAGVARESLRYWGRANLRAARLGESRLSDRFLLVNYNELCADPRPAIAVIASFLGVSLSGERTAALCALADTGAPRSRAERFADADFDPADVDVLREFGFDVTLRLA
jgi:Sulfotransferase family